MSAIIKNTIRVLSANQFINAFSSSTYNQWASGQAYTAGTIVYNSSFKYIATSSGTSGPNAPVHASGTVSDGSVSWLFVEIFEDTNNFENKVYLTIGKTDPWDNPNVGGEDPIVKVDNFADDLTTLTNIVSAKKIEANSVKMAIKRYDWDITGSTVYDEFDPTKAFDDYANPFYVLSNNNIYKCINNNNGAVSVSQPTGTNINQFTTPGDNYTWKYMSSVDPSDVIQFLVSTYIPVEYKTADDGSIQWDVQENAKKTSISTIKVDNGGTGYTSATITIDAPTGTNPVQAAASPIISGGIITGIDVTNIGSGYLTIPTVTITGDGTGAVGTAVLAPKDGHGANILTELDARYAVINIRLDSDESGYFPVTGENDFREIGVVLDPKGIDDNVANESLYIGPSHPSWDGAETASLKEFQSGTGELLYIDSVAPIIRALNQIESLSIILKF